ncbi:MAG: endonuclease [Bacteroidales bacterium]|nr:endonuclease [Bacteroidales bacterium]
MKKLLALFIGLSLSVLVSAQPANYYNSANGLTGNQLKVALHNIIKGHSSISYSQLWNAFWSTDNKGNGVVWDMYSDRPNGNPPYTYYLGQDQCGNYNSEGDCYNREHSWPQSWFNEQTVPRSDLHHIFPTDGFVNGKRANYPFGEVRSATWTSQNGSKLGTCKTPGYSGTVFEPIDEYKGDFARALMYMSVRYYSEDGSWSSSDMTNKSEIKKWAIDMLLRWNEQDPVSEKEKERNEVIYNDYQHNRNPFVDHPEYARMIWDPTWSAVEETSEAVFLFPNPIEAGQVLHVSGNSNSFDAVVICDLSGRTLLKAIGNAVGDFAVTLPNDLAKGCYIVKLMRNGSVVKYEKLLVK